MLIDIYGDKLTTYKSLRLGPPYRRVSAARRGGDAQQPRARSTEVPVAVVVMIQYVHASSSFCI